MVYNGKGACKEGCASAIARIARQVVLKVRYINSKTLTAESLQGASVYIQPGGDALDVLKVVSPEQLELIREFIADGGSYLGICAGAFLADTYVDDDKKVLGLGILPGETIDYHSPRPDPQPPEPNEEILPTTWIEGLLPGIAGPRQMYFSEGTGFRLRPASASLEVLSLYADGTPSAVRFVHGAGKVLLTGVHPEPPQKWRNPNKDRTQPLVDSDGLDYDIARAMLGWLIQP